MTEEQKEILIAKMLDAPSSLSDGELDSILNDNELREIYEASAALSNAGIRQPELDMNAEWNQFRPRLRRKPSMMRWMMRVAAIFIGVLFVSNIVVRIIDYVFTDEQQYVIAKMEQIPKVGNDTVTRKITHVAAIKETPHKASPHKEPVIARKQISMADQHLSQASEYQSEVNTPQIEEDIDIDEYLRVQQARIDNDLAMQVAESYAEEYDDLVTLLDAVGTHNSALDKIARKVTME